MRLTNKTKTDSAIHLACFVLDYLILRLYDNVFDSDDIETLIDCVNVSLKTKEYNTYVVNSFISIHNTLTTQGKSSIKLDSIRQKINNKLQIQ